jgi:hypothetical protein
MRRTGTGRRGKTPAQIGVMSVPDPRTWPEEVRAWFRAATGECGPSDVFIFDHGVVGALYLQDAITAAAILDISISEWHTEQGYPVFTFVPQRIGEIERRLGLCGYTVHILQQAENGRQPQKHRRAPVISIASARKQIQEAQPE